IIERGTHVSVVDIDEGTRTSTFAHELGHLLGLGHSRRQVYESLEENDRNATPGTFPWSLGHGLDSEFVTTMGNEPKFNVNQRLELFSDPTKTCNGSFACGVDKSDPLLGADAAATLRFTYQQAKKISDGRAPYIYRKYWDRILQIPQGKFWMELLYGALDPVDGTISQSVKIIDTYDLEVLGRQSVVLEVQNSSGRSVRFEDFVEVVSDADRDAISDAEELAVGTDPDDQSSCFDCYVFRDGVRAGLRGTEGDDVLVPDPLEIAADVTSYGLGGDDTLGGRELDDNLFGGSGDDRLSGKAGDDELFGGSGDDLILGGLGKDQLFGGSGDDYLYGDEDDDQLFGGSGVDVIYGGLGKDQLFGGSGDDFLYGGSDDDQISAGDGDDLVRGYDGNDFISGGSGFDFLYGGSGSDKLVIEKGGGLLKGEAGNDTLFVNTESDEEESRYDVRGFELGDSLALSASIETVRSGVFRDSGTQVQVIELSDSSTIYIYEPFVGMPELSQFICSTDTSLSDYSAFRGGGAACDLDGDQIVDSNDALPFDRFETVDTDLDGIGNNADRDDDNDGLTDAEEVELGTDPLVFDSDGDGVGDSEDDFPLDSKESFDTDGDGIGNNADDDDDNDGLTDDEEIELGTNPLVPDSDGDGVNDPNDEFPLDATESVDSDRDGIGNNADLDDDNDGFSDEQEELDGTDPLSRFSCRSGCFSFDVDENLEAQPLTDGLLVIRHLFGFSGDSLISGAVSSDASRDASDTIASYLTDADSQLDIDGDGESKPLTDGLLLIRYLFGFSGDSLVSGAIGSGATRDTAEAVEAYIKERIPAE
ncbi:hypothetical protein N9I05_03945, partial [Pseudomonadales bacterium]|nr:hypothetical protein [Pseudomonadales bacterium]